MGLLGSQLAGLSTSVTDLETKNAALTAEVARLKALLAAQPTPPPPPPIPPLPELPGVIPAGTDIAAADVAAALLAAANGAVFRVRPGTVSGKELIFKSGQQVWALDPQNPPLFDGAGKQWFARGPASNVVLGYLRYKNYAPAVSTWVNVEGDSFRRTGGIQGNTLPDSRLYKLEGFENGWAIQGGDRMLVEACHLHHNHQMGISANGRTGIKVIGGEWDNNNRRPDGKAWYNWRWEAGSSKFVKCTNLLIEGVFAHDNVGPGPWTDIDNDLVTFKNNRCLNNQGPGIFHEVSFRAIIEGNECRNNGDAANIYISNCKGRSAADPIRILNNRSSGHGLWEIGLGNAAHRPPPPGGYLDFVEVKDNVLDGALKLFTYGTPPVPTSIVQSNNKRSDGTAVVLTRGSQ